MLKMTEMCDVIKKEPDEPSSPSSEDAKSDTRCNIRDLEFVNIKNEIDINIQPIRIKQEPDITSIKLITEDVIVKIPSSNVPSWHMPVMEDSNINSELEIEVEETNQKYPKNKSNSEAIERLIEWKLTSNGKYACAACDKEYTSLGHFHRHVAVHSRIIYTCTLCSKDCRSQEHLDNHRKTHEGYKCDVCDKSFNSSSNLSQHKRVHLDEKPFKCEKCEKQFTVKSNFLKHQKSRCKIFEPIVCEICNKVFKTRYLLKSHVRSHNDERPFSCEICHMNFKYNSTLLRHLQQHSGTRRYSCKECGKSFTHLSLLNPHLRTHTGERPYPCTICSKKFSHKHNMERHMQRHSKPKNLTCEVCNKKFPRESRLIYHMRTHANEKSFQCGVCTKKFTHKQNVIRHYRRKHPNERYDGKETDAGIALKYWDEIVSKKFNVKNAETNEDNGKNILELKCEVDSDDEVLAKVADDNSEEVKIEEEFTEEILPDKISYIDVLGKVKIELDVDDQITYHKD